MRASLAWTYFAFASVSMIACESRNDGGVAEPSAPARRSCVTKPADACGNLYETAEEPPREGAIVWAQLPERTTESIGVPKLALFAAFATASGAAARRRRRLRRGCRARMCARRGGGVVINLRDAGRRRNRRGRRRRGDGLRRRHEPGLRRGRRACRRALRVARPGSPDHEHQHEHERDDDRTTGDRRVERLHLAAWPHRGRVRRVHRRREHRVCADARKMLSMSPSDKRATTTRPVIRPSASTSARRSSFAD